MRFLLLGVLAACAAVIFAGAISASTPADDVRLTNDCHPDSDCGAGYVSVYTLATGLPYTDQTLDECTISKGRQNEPAVAVDPRDTSVVLGSSNDYCGVYNRGAAAGAIGPIWLGYYRSQDSGQSFTSSLVPGYPDDQSPYAALSKARTASAGDPVIAWDGEGRAFFGSESSDDPAGTPKTFGDVWVARFRNPEGTAGPTARDGLEYYGTTIVARGSSAPNLLGKFNDKTTIEADHNGGRCDNNVYFAWSQFHGNRGGVGIEFSRSTNHGVTFSKSLKVSQTISDVQFPDIAVTGNSNVYLVFRSFASGRGPEKDSIYYVKSTNCGATFTRPKLLQTFVPNDAVDESAPEAAPRQTRPDDPAGKSEPDQGSARDCGDFADHCESGYTFFRRDTQPRATADQFDTANPDRFYVVYDATKGAEVPTGTTYGTDGQGIAGQAAIFFLRVNGATGAKVGPTVIDNEAIGHQVFPDISADNPNPGTQGRALHVIWWDSRNDPCYAITRPIGNCATGVTKASLDAFAAVSHNAGSSWSSDRVSDVTTNPNYEQFDNRAVPFAGDYLYVSSVNDFSYGVWTDWRNTVPGDDPRETEDEGEDEDAGTADVVQCRTQDANGTWSGDTCPHAGGLDQNIYGDYTP
jgi:hypothetical protein